MQLKRQSRKLRQGKAKRAGINFRGKSKKSTTGQVWTITIILSIFTWNVGKFVVKDTPTVLGVAWQVKKRFQMK